MNTVVFLIALSVGGGANAHHIVITEMPNMQICESVGKSLVRMSTYIKWNCIEGVR